MGGRPKGIAFIKYKNKSGVDAALKFNGEDYAGRTLTVNLAGDKPKGGKDNGKGKGKDGKDGKGKSKGNQEQTVCVKGLSFETDEATLRKDFAECGEIEQLRALKNEEGGFRGIAFIEFKTKEGFEAALKFNEDTYGGRTIYVSKAGEGGNGKDKDGKGKGKDGKDKGK